MDDKALRKAWLKKKFASWEYHEALLALHDQYLSALHRHWSRPDIQKQYPGDYKAMQSPVFLNFDNVSKSGTTRKSGWSSKPTVGWADSIAYNFNRGYDFAGCDEYAGMADSERDQLNLLVGKMLAHCENILHVAESGYVSRRKGTDDIILDEEITGPITWPIDWREDLIGRQGATLGATSAPRIKGGEPAPQDGLWQALDPSNRQQRAQSGEVLPDLNSAYGTTLWQRIGD